MNAARAAEELRRREALARAARERHADELRAAVIALVRKQGLRGWLIGSLAWGGFGERSDVDLVLEAATSERAIALELELARTLRVPADVLAIEELPSDFAARVRREGIPIDV